MKITRSFITPITRKRLARFRKMKLAWLSLWLLLGLYVVSLGSELLCNGNPLFVRYEGKSHFPVFFYYPEDTFVPGGVKTRPDYKKINSLPEFQENDLNFMIFPLVAFGPFESIDPATIKTSDNVKMSVRQVPRVGTVNVGTDLEIKRSNQADGFLGLDGQSAKGLILPEQITVPPDLQTAIQQRFDNTPSTRFTVTAKDARRMDVELSLSTFKKRSRAPTSVRLTIKDMGVDKKQTMALYFSQDLKLTEDGSNFWPGISKDVEKELLARVQAMHDGYAEPLAFRASGLSYVADFNKDEVRFPYPPVKGHWMGIDSAGRDVLARILYGLRTSLSFGLILVLVSMILGTMAGAVQGYYGGLTDISGQRLTEIWSAIPFLYVMILLGSVYGRSFLLLLVCYAIFNWIGISYYMRAEFLRLRKQAFVESAKCMGIPDHKIMMRHILPNGLVPIITFFPFSLVGAIGALAALDYLGFGLPPPTPSWGELLAQAQRYRWAWWLILYPSLALFVVMLLGVFIGEGVRNAFDPKQYSRLK